MERYVIPACLLIALAGCMGVPEVTSTASTNQPTPVTVPQNCTTVKYIQSSGVEYPEYPENQSEKKITQFVKSFEKSYARFEYYDGYESDFNVSVGDTTIVDPSEVNTSRINSSTQPMIVSIDDIYITAESNGDPIDINYAVTYVVVDDGIQRIQRFRSDPPLKNKGEYVVRCA